MRAVNQVGTSAASGGCRGARARTGDHVGHSGRGCPGPGPGVPGLRHGRSRTPSAAPPSRRCRSAPTSSAYSCPSDESAPFTFTMDVGGPTTLALQVTAFDADGNYGRVEVPVTVLEAPPSVRIDSPAERRRRRQPQQAVHGDRDGHAQHLHRLTHQRRWSSWRTTRPATSSSTDGTTRRRSRWRRWRYPRRGRTGSRRQAWDTGVPLRHRRAIQVVASDSPAAGGGGPGSRRPHVHGRAWVRASSSSGESCCSHSSRRCLGVGTGFGATVDRGHHDAVAAVVERGPRPGQVAAHVAERVVPHDREVAQRVARLGPQRRDLLAQTQDVFGEASTPVRRLRPGVAARSAARRTRRQHHDDDDEDELRG